MLGLRDSEVHNSGGGWSPVVLRDFVTFRFVSVEPFERALGRLDFFTGPSNTSFFESFKRALERLYFGMISCYRPRPREGETGNGLQGGPSGTSQPSARSL